MMDLMTGILHQNVNIFYLINNGMDNGILDFVMPLITNLGSFIAWVLVCGILFVFGGNKGKKVALLGFSALLIGNVAVFLLKYLVAEPRPFLALSHVDLLVPENEIYSFPSGHTASSFAVATIIGLKYKMNFKGRRISLIYPLLAFAGVIGFSRIYIGVHYPLDVIFGAIVGILSAILVLKVEDNYFVDKLSHTCMWDKIQNFIRHQYK